jgi:hypothetical protein
MRIYYKFYFLTWCVHIFYTFNCPLFVWGKQHVFLVYSTLKLRFIIPQIEVCGGYIGVTWWSVSWSVGLSVGPAVRCIFFVRSITWKLLVVIQNNFIQWSNTIRGSAVYNNNNSILSNYRVIALCYFSITFFVRIITCRLMVGIQYNFIVMVKHIERKCSAQEP